VQFCQLDLLDSESGRDDCYLICFGCLCPKSRAADRRAGETDGGCSRSGPFTLSVYGANFVPGAVVTWNGKPRKTTFISGHELRAHIRCEDVAKNTAGLISVTNPSPRGGKSSTWAQVEVHAPISTIKVTAPQQYPIGDWLLMAADFNHDGNLDLVGEYGAFLELYAGKGDATFQYESIAGRGYSSVWPGVYGDFNGDGNLDVAFPHGPDSLSNTQYTVMLGDGKGKFKFKSVVPNRDLFLAAVGDFNQDGKLDLVAKGYGLFVYLGNGDGTFHEFKNFPYGDLANEIVTGDLNGDGKLDLLLLQVSNGGIVLNVLLGKGDGTFHKPVQIGSFGGSVLCGAQLPGNVLTDLNGDGKLDIVFCNQTEIIILLGNGDGTFQPPLSVTAGTQGAFTYAVGDINSDGKPDLIVSQYSGFASTIGVFLGNGDGSFQPEQIVASGFPFGELGIVPGDLNSDGLLDFVFQTGGGSEVYEQK